MLDAPGSFNSQAQQDVTVLRLLRNKTNGFYLDLAANEPVFMSNTRALERDFAWKGVCIEANPVYWVGLALQRSCTIVGAAISEGLGEVRFRGFSQHRGKAREGGIVGYDHSENGCTNCGDFKARTLPLSKVFSELTIPSQIDYFSLDIEGAELAAMATFPFETHRFALMTVERPKPALQELLHSNGYWHVCDHGSFGDQLWVDSRALVSTRSLLVREGPTKAPPYNSTSEVPGRRCDTHAGVKGYMEKELGKVLSGNVL
jgi:hypothetical protein